MKRYCIEDYISLENPKPDHPYRPEILTTEEGARSLGGMLGVLVPGSQVPYHYHRSRESVILFIQGEGFEIVEGVKHPVKEGDLLFIAAGEKHTLINPPESSVDLRYLEFFTCPPVSADFVEVKG